MDPDTSTSVSQGTRRYGGVTLLEYEPRKPRQPLQLVRFMIGASLVSLATVGNLQVAFHGVFDPGAGGFGLLVLNVLGSVGSVLVSLQWPRCAAWLKSATALGVGAFIATVLILFL
jgi:hypothetical protein